MIKLNGKAMGLLFAATALALVAAACGGSSQADTSSGGGSSKPLSGKLTISGSSTVEPITSLVAEQFQSANPDVSVSVDGPGTTDGFALFCDGKTQISDASRPIDTAAEVPLCKKNGVKFIELKIGIDGITVLTNPANSAVSCLDFKDLYALIGPESKGFKNWSDANALGTKIGAGHVPYPNVPLDITGPGEESGTWGSFIDLALKSIGEDRGFDEVTTRPDYQSSANDNVIIQGIEGSDSSLGWVGFSYYEQNQGNVKAIKVDNGEGSGCVAPATGTIADKSYPLSRDLYIYVNAKDAKSSPMVKAFVDFYLGDGFSSVTQVGYVNEPNDVIQQTKATWQKMTIGTQQG